MKDNWFPCPSVELLVAPYGHLPMDAIGVLTVLRSQQWESRAGGIPVDIEDIYRAIKRRDDRGMTRKRFDAVWDMIGEQFPIQGGQRVDLELAQRRAGRKRGASGSTANDAPVTRGSTAGDAPIARGSTADHTPPTSGAAEVVENKGPATDGTSPTDRQTDREKRETEKRATPATGAVYGRRDLNQAWEVAIGGPAGDSSQVEALLALVVRFAGHRCVTPEVLAAHLLPSVKPVLATWAPAGSGKLWTPTAGLIADERHGGKAFGEVLAHADKTRGFCGKPPAAAPTVAAPRPGWTEADEAARVARRADIAQAVANAVTPPPEEAKRELHNWEFIREEKRWQRKADAPPVSP